MQHWEIHLAFLSLSFLTCQMGMPRKPQLVVSGTIWVRVWVKCNLTQHCLANDEHLTPSTGLSPRVGTAKKKKTSNKQSFRVLETSSPNCRRWQGQLLGKAKEEFAQLLVAASKPWHSLAYRHMDGSHFHPFSTLCPPCCPMSVSRCS